MIANAEPAVGREIAEPGHRILVITSDEDRATALRDLLGVEGVERVEAVADARKALPVFRELHPDLVVLESSLDHMDAASVIRQLDSRARENEFLPFLVLDAYGSRPADFGALDSSIAAFFRGAASSGGVATDAQRLLAIREKRFRVGMVAERMMEKAVRIEHETAVRLAQMARLKDHDGHDHVFQVGRLSALIAAELGFDGNDRDLIRSAAPLHDIGMIGIPDAIRLKDGPLSLEELDVMKTHTTLGARILAGGSSPLFHMAEEIALYHHENWDGTGYTPGLEGEAIPVVARIVRVADLFDAVTRQRAFDSPWTRAEAIDFLRGRAGRFFDPDVVEAFLKVCERGEDSGRAETPASEQTYDVTAFGAAATGTGIPA
ncbi:MAG: HD domain-containing protein [Gemmatimonadota bacterium]|jgi:putative two-component system response regulator